MRLRGPAVGQRYACVCTYAIWEEFQYIWHKKYRISWGEDQRSLTCSTVHRMSSTQVQYLYLVIRKDTWWMVVQTWPYSWLIFHWCTAIMPGVNRSSIVYRVPWLIQPRILYEFHNHLGNFNFPPFLLFGFTNRIVYKFNGLWRVLNDLLGN